MSNELTAVDVVRRSKPYRVPRASTPIDIYLDGNEGVLPDATALGALDELDANALRRYPSTASLAAILAEKVGVKPEQLVVTAGADDAIDRVCRAVLGPGRNAVIPVPTFEMVPRFAEITGAQVRRVEFGDTAFPIDAVLEATDENTRLIVVISPNNPTGVTATISQIERLAHACPQSLILVDHAYVEFADADITSRAVDFQNLVVTRTLSKAWGLAGLRVGYAVGRQSVVNWLRTAGNPYPVSAPSMVLAETWLDEGQASVTAFVDRIVNEREQLGILLTELGFEPARSRANFVFARVGDGVWWRDALAGLGFGVRAFPGREGLEDAMRIACPGDNDVMERLEHAIRTVADPEAVLFDLDGVFADVSRSYRRAVIETAKSFGIEIRASDISKAKAAGNANNDWRVTQKLLADRGINAELSEVTERFQQLYQGTEARPGLWTEETLLIEPAFLKQIRDSGRKIGIVTGRPRRDAQRFLAQFGLEQFLETLVCMEDAALKPDPEPLQMAMRKLGVTRAWYVGDTPDDMRAARGARALPLGIIAPEEQRLPMRKALLAAGAGRVLGNLDDLLEVL